MQFAVNLLQTIKPAKYITHHFSMNEASKAYELINKHPELRLQIVLEP